MPIFSVVIVIKLPHSTRVHWSRWLVPLSHTKSTYLLTSGEVNLTRNFVSLRKLKTLCDVVEQGNRLNVKCILSLSPWVHLGGWVHNWQPSEQMANREARWRSNCRLSTSQILSEFSTWHISDSSPSRISTFIGFFPAKIHVSLWSIKSWWRRASQPIQTTNSRNI